jgi:uncharacterized membrane protein HdeD (DUF308 family)
MPVQEPDLPGFLHAIQQNARMAVIAGVVMVLCGLLAIAAPLAAGLSVTVLVGVLLAIGGVAQCFLAFQAGAFGRGLLIFLFGVLSVIAGLFLFGQPLEGLEAITLFLAAYFIATGIAELIAAFQICPAPTWGWMLLNGSVTLILGIMIWRQYPVSGAWAVGLLFGIKLLMSGGALIGIAGAARKAASDAVA